MSRWVETDDIHQHNNECGTTIQCQLYNDWTRGDRNDRIFIVQSPTGNAYKLTYPAFDRYRGTDIYDRFFKMLEYHIITTNHTDTETWIAPVSYDDMCLIRDYGMPITMLMQDWMLTYDESEEPIELEEDVDPNIADFHAWLNSRTNPNNL
jgi:hypothetical protein